VVTGLREATKITGKVPLVYADAPHHGSMLEQPGDFFAAVDPEVFAVSTDGTYGHGHPDKAFLDKISIAKKACWFNYKSHALPSISRLNTQGVRLNEVQETFSNANYIRNKHNLPAEYALRIIVTKDMTQPCEVNADGTMTGT
jgi:hypothetical protein